MIRSDVVIVGGGIVGLSTAFALARRGVTVHVLECKPRDARYTGGDVIHPRGIEAFELLELGPSLRSGRPLQGFHVHDIDCGNVLLDYACAGQRRGLTIEHGALHRSVLGAVDAQTLVTLVHEAHVEEVEFEECGAVVTARARGKTMRFGCRLLIGADGAASKVRHFAGMRDSARRVAIIAAVDVAQDALPDGSHGHLYTGGGALVLAYPLHDGRARVLVDHGTTRPGTEHGIADWPSGLPLSLARGILSGTLRGTFPVHGVNVEQPCRPGVVLLGDAACACHPVTASGITAGMLDAIALVKAFDAMNGDLGTQARHHLQNRAPARRTRSALASMVREVLVGDRPGHRLLRAATFGYWRSQHGGPAATAMLAMSDERPVALVRALSHIFAGALPQWRELPGQRMRALAGALDMTRRYGTLLFGGGMPGPCIDPQPRLQQPLAFKHQSEGDT